MQIKGYKEVDYNKLIAGIKKAFDASTKSAFTIADELQLKSVSTVFNCMKNDVQKVTDEKLTTFANHINFDCCIVMIAGNKKFYIKA